MPDGTVIRNVPEGTTQAELQRRYAAHVSASSAAPAAARAATPPASAAGGVAPAAEPTRSKGVELANFVTGNIDEGILRTIGSPVDAIGNIVDLGIAASGTIGREAFGMKPESLPTLIDRSRQVGTGDWLVKQARRLGITAPESAVVPTSAAGQVGAAALQGGVSALMGRGLPMRGTAPTTAGGLARSAAGGALSGGAAGGVGAAGGSPAAQITAGMLPGMAHQAVPVGQEAIRRGLVGSTDVKGRRDTATRAGLTNPNAAAITGSRVLGGAEGTLARLPGGGAPIDAAAEQRAQQLHSRVVEAARDLVPDGPVSAERAGRGVEAGIEGDVERMRTQQRGLYAEVDKRVDPAQPIPLANFRAKLRELANPVKGAEATSAQLVPAKTRALFEAVETDLAGVEAKPKIDPNEPLKSELEPMPPTPGTPEAVGDYLEAMARRRAAIDKERAARDKAIAEGAAKGPETVDNAVIRRRDKNLERIDRKVEVKRPAEESGRAAKDSLPYEVVAGIRAQVGRLLESPSLLADAPKNEYKALYRALSDDMRAALPPDARQAWDRASRYTRAMHDRVDTVYQPLMSKNTPEKALAAAMSGTRQGSSSLRKIMGALPPAQRDAVAAHVIEKLGAAPAGQQGVTGERFAPETFLTNWNKLDDSARRALFPGRSYADMKTVATAIEHMREAGRGTYNPSGTARAVTHAGMAGGVTTAVLESLFYGHPGVAAGVAAGAATQVVGTRAIARAITNPAFVRWLAEGTKVPQTQLGDYALRLNAIARSTRDPETRQAIEDVAAQLGADPATGGQSP